MSFLSLISRHYRIMLLSFAVALGIFTVALTFYLRGRMLMEEQIDLRLVSAASVASVTIDVDQIDSIKPESLNTKIVQRMGIVLSNVLRSVPDAEGVHVLRFTDVPGVMELVADDSMANLRLDAQSMPGDLVMVSGLEPFTKRPFEKPAVERSTMPFQNQYKVTGYAPIFRSNGEIAAVLAISMDADQYTVLSQSMASPLILQLVLVFGVLIAGYIGLFFWRSRAQHIELLNRRWTGFRELAAHQLAGPFMTFRALAQQQMDAEQDQEQAGRIQERIAQMNSVVDALKGMHDFQTEEIMDGHSASCTVRDVVMKLLEQEQSRIERLHLQPEIIINDNVSVACQSEFLEGVLRELIDNIIRFAPKNTTITLLASVKDGDVRIDVHNEGPPIAKEESEKIFGKFIRGSNAEEHYPEGVGLGLYIAKQMVELLNGAMWSEPVESGATLSFTLPASQ